MAGVPPSRETLKEQLREHAKRKQDSADRTFLSATSRPGTITEEVAIETLRNRLMHLKVLKDHRDPEEGNKYDDRVWRNPGKAIFQGSANYFNFVFREWVRSVNEDVKRYERKLMVDAYVKDGTRLGFWSSGLGVTLAKFFPKTFGQDMTAPPPYFDIWTPREREVADTYLTYLELARLRPFSLGFAAGATATPFLFLYAKYIVRIPKFPNILWLPYATISFGLFAGLFSIPFLRPLHNRKKSMHNLMHSRDSFVAAKARKFYDDMTYPSDIRYHNRFYLDYVPRDKFDEFAWTLLDSQIRSGNFDRDEWAFTLRRPGQFTRDLYMTHSSMTWKERRDRYVKEIFQFFGWGFWWDKNGEDVLRKVSTFDDKIEGWMNYLKSKLPAKEASEATKHDTR